MVETDKNNDSRGRMHTKNVRLCVWWDYKGIIYYELLSPNQTTNSETYCAYIAILKAKIEKSGFSIGLLVFIIKNCRTFQITQYLLLWKKFCPPLRHPTHDAMSDATALRCDYRSAS